jgi:uridine monophosphate synthetase
MRSPRSERLPFFDALTRAATRANSLLCIGLDPAPDQIPANLRAAASSDAEAALAWNRTIIEATADLVCAYKPNSAFYEAMGEEGMACLRATLDLIPPEVPIILDVKRGDIGNTAAAYARACFDDLDVDAVTLSPYLGRDSVEPFARHTGRGLFVLCHTSNPSAGAFQHLEISDWRTLDREANQPLYMHVAREAVSWSPDVGLVVGATYPEAIAAVRAAAPQAWFLVPGVGAQGGDLEATLAAGLRDDGLGVIINVGRAVSGAADPRAAALALRDAIAAARAAPRGTATPSAPAERSLAALYTALHEIGAVKFGSFTLASGMQSPIYVDLRLLVGKPSLLAEAARAYAALLEGIECDRLCGVPYAALPIATAVSLESDLPLINPRKEVKQHGLGKEIEGVWQAGERVVIIEDLITSGGSTIQTAERLRAAGLVVEHALVLIDREQGGVEALAAAGIAAQSVFTLTALLEALAEAGRISRAQQAEVLAFLGK